MTMHVALLNGKWYPNRGGGIVHVEELATRLVTNHDCRVDVIVKERGSEAPPTSLPTGATVVEVPGTATGVRPLDELRYAAGVLRLTRSERYDVVHAHTNATTLPLQVLRFNSDVRTVVTVHGANLDFSVSYTGSPVDRVYSMLRGVILKRFEYDAVISVSAELRSVLSEYHDRVEYLPNGVDVDAFPVPGPGPASDELLFVGRLRPKKNPDDIVRALPRVRQTHPGAVVHLVGTGTLRERLAELVDDRGLSEAVRIHGRVSDGQLQKLYRRCSVFVLPSDWEGHPLVLLEAWASGMVVVGTDVEGIREFVQDTDYGELVPLGDEIQLAETITSLLSHPEQTATRGRRAREYVAENYDWDATAHRTYDLYQSLHRPV